MQAPFVGTQVTGPVKRPVGLLVNVIKVSVEENPVTVALTLIPGGPVPGVSLSVGVPAVTKNDAEATSVSGGPTLPFAVTL